jgi:hypothetical protein
VNTFRSFISLYILSTTANFPDILVRPYRISPLFALIFVAYCIIVTKVMLSLITAVIYNRYKGYIQNDIKSSVKLRRIKLHTAFRLLDVYNRGKLFYNEWYQLMRVLRPDYNECVPKSCYSERPVLKLFFSFAATRFVCFTASSMRPSLVIWSRVSSSVSCL